MDTVSLSFILFFLILASAYFSASEIALFSLPLTKIKSYQSSSNYRQRLIANLVLEPKNLLVTVFMLNTFVNILIQNTTSHLYGQAASWLLKVGVPFVLMLLFGEIIPKNIGLQNNVAIANKVAPSINFLQKFIAPVRDLIVKITAPISRMMFFFLKPEENISKEEIKHVLKASEEWGLLQQDEAELVKGYFHLQDATAKTLMRPKNDIIFYDCNDPLSKLVYLFAEQECSRLPVCDKSLDQILGIITARQYFLHKAQIKNSADLTKYLLSPLYVPETTSARALIRRFDESHQVLALVVDEYGSVTGLVTKEDIAEQVIGDITDLRDTKNLYIQSGKDEVIANGQFELVEFNDYFNTNLVSENNMLTIGGWLIEQAGEIPQNGAKYEFEGFLFHILSADPNKIKRIYIRKLNGNTAKRQ